jgi:hypothetical protein
LIFLSGEKRVSTSANTEELRSIHMEKGKRIMFFRKGEKTIKEIPEG